MVDAAGVIEYRIRWNQPGTPLSEAQARARDAAGEEYTAVLPARPGTHGPVLVTPAWRTGVVVVTFLDGAGRRSVEYVFARHGDRLFLGGVHLWTYPNDDPLLRLSDAIVHEDVRFRDDGRVQRVITDKDKGFRDTVDYTDVPLDTNWEPVPAFGDYDSIARFERGMPPLGGDPG